MEANDLEMMSPLEFLLQFVSNTIGSIDIQRAIDLGVINIVDFLAKYEKNDPIAGLVASEWIPVKLPKISIQMKNEYTQFQQATQVFSDSDMHLSMGRDFPCFRKGDLESIDLFRCLVADKNINSPLTLQMCEKRNAAWLQQNRNDLQNIKYQSGSDPRYAPSYDEYSITSNSVLSSTRRFVFELIAVAGLALGLSAFLGTGSPSPTPPPEILIRKGISSQEFDKREARREASFIDCKKKAIDNEQKWCMKEPGDIPEPIQILYSADPGRRLKNLMGPEFQPDEPFLCDEWYGNLCLPSNKYMTAGMFMFSGQPLSSLDSKQQSLKGCLRLAHLEGRFNCTYPLEPLIPEIRVARAAASEAEGGGLKARGSDMSIPWEIEMDRIQSPNEAATDIDKIIYTIYIAMLYSILGSDSANTYVHPQRMKIYDDSRESFPDYQHLDIRQALLFESEVEEIGQTCSTGAGIEAPDYRQCTDEYLKLYDYAAADVEENFRKDGPIYFPTGSTLVWAGMGANNFLLESIPAWAKSSRTQRDVFVKWMLNKTNHCGDGTTGRASKAVCFADSEASGQIKFVNPWLGGDFNPYETCDTFMDESSAESIWSTCHPQVCQEGFNSAYYTNTPVQRCVSANGNHVQRSNVPAYDQNLCRHAPIQKTDCEWPQGMLNSAKGNAVKSTYNGEHLPKYVHEEISREGRGLFMNSGNPAYRYGSVPLPDDYADTHSVLRMHEEDLGGHHVAMKITKSGLFHIHRTPLASPMLENDLSAAQSYRKSSLLSRETHGTTGWLENLRGALLREDARVIEPLYPTNVQLDGEKNWACPLLRYAFWNGQAGGESFSPLLPSPLRSARLFKREGKDQTYGTRAHPTQMVGPLAR